MSVPRQSDLFQRFQQAQVCHGELGQSELSFVAFSKSGELHNGNVKKKMQARLLIHLVSMATAASVSSDHAIATSYSEEHGGLLLQPRNGPAPLERLQWLSGLREGLTFLGLLRKKQARHR